MAEVLAVDIGESFVGAAIERAGRPTLVELGSGRPFAPCALHLPPEGDVTVGEEADELAVRAPHLVARRFWRRLGDDIPFIVGGRAWPAEALVAEVLRWAARAAGVAPAAVTLAACRPLDWGEHFQGRLRAAAERAGFVSFVSSPSPLAAARWYLDQGALRAPATIAVYDFGGLGCDAAVVRVNERSELEPVGRPVRLDDVGGANLDHILYVLAAEALGLDVALYRSLDQRDLIEMEALRNAAAAAKERLSSESATTITANVHGRPLEVRITRSEFEERALGVIERTTASLRGALAGAGLDAEALDAIVVVGGASAVPLVSAVLAEEFGRPLVTDGHARAAALFGALAMARAAAPARLSPPVSPIAPVEVQRRTPAARFEPPTRAVPAAGPRPVAPPPERDAEPAPRSWGPPPAAATPAPSPGPGPAPAGAPEPPAPPLPGPAGPPAFAAEATRLAPQVRVAVVLPSGERFALEPGAYTVGRSSSANFVIADPRVSRWHCELRVGPYGSVAAVDLDSKNGVWVGGERKRLHVLHESSDVHLGPVGLRVEIDR